MGVVINLTAVVAAAVVQMILGSIWYGPLFGKVWVKLAGFTDKDKAEAMKKGMGKTYAAAFGGALLTAYVFAYMVSLIEVSLIEPIGWLGGLQMGFLFWLGFIATSFLGQVLWMGKSRTLYLIDVGYHLVALMAVGALLSVWR